MEQLSLEMKRAIRFAHDHDGKLIRHPGGFWAGREFSRFESHFGTTTVAALVARGVATYTDWKQSHGRQFPIEATVHDYSSLTGQ